MLHAFSIVMMVAAVFGAAASTADLQNPKTAVAQEERSRRPPLLPSEKDYSNGVANNQRKPKSRIVSSRYLSSPSTSTSTSNSSSVSSSSSSSRRHPSPSISTPASNGLKRSVSADRRRPATVRPLMPDPDSKDGNAAEVSAATKLLVTSTRSLSVSFQGESFSFPISKTKAAPPSPNARPERRRGGTPLRGKVDGGGDQVENSKPSDHNRWPARNRVANPLLRSPDCRGGGERSKAVGSANGTRTLQQLMNDEPGPSLDLENSGVLKAAPFVSDHRDSVNFSLTSDLTASDSDSVSSDSTSGVQEFGGAVNGRNGPRGIAVSARFWQETNSRLRRLQDPGSPLSMSPTSKLHNLKRSSSDTSSRGGIRPASPSKLTPPPLGSSPSRGHSPSRVKNAVSTINNSFVETPSILSFAVDVRRSKVGDSRIFDAHLVRLLYNRNLQWRFGNARTEAVMQVQKLDAEVRIYLCYLFEYAYGYDMLFLKICQCDWLPFIMFEIMINIELFL